MAYDDDVQRTNEVRLAWVPGVSPESVFLLLDASRRASVHLEREETNGYWRTSLEVSVCYVSSVSKTQSADADAYTAPGSQSGLRGGRRGGSTWVPPGDKVGDGFSIEYWRFLLPSESVDFCHNLGYAEILLPSLIGYDGTVSWSIEPDGPNGTGNLIVFNPSELAPGAYDVVIGIDTLEGTLEKAITLNVRSLSVTTHRIIVDANDTTMHYLPINPAGTFIPTGEDFVVISVPEGIDSVDFVPADLTPGTTYTVDIWNGDCGYQTVDVIAVEMKVEPQAEWPKGVRSDLGVGEILDCSVKPSNLTAMWSCTTGKAQFASPNSSSTTLSILDVPGGLTVTVSIEGLAISTNYSVHAPQGIAYSEPSYRKGFNPDIIASGGVVQAVIAPTNVCFDNIILMEEECDVTWYSGCFTETEVQKYRHGTLAGARSPLSPTSGPEHLGSYFSDMIEVETDLSEGDVGYMAWEIPINWKVNNLDSWHVFGDGTFLQTFDVAENGTSVVSKHGTTFTRTIRNSMRGVGSNGFVLE